MNIIILGGDGRLSHAVSRAAVEAGHHAVAVTRSGQLRHPIEDVSVRQADAMDADTLTAACEGADVVFNGLNPPYPQWRKLAMPMAQHVVLACRAVGARLLFPGNVYAHGEGMPERLLPDTPPQPTTRKGRIRREMEALFEASGLDVAVLRAGDFYGGTVPGSWFDLMVAAKVDKGVFTYPGPMDRGHAWAYLPDLARAFVRLAEAEWHGFNRLGFEGHSMTGAEMKASLDRASGRDLKAKGVPWPLLRLLGLVQPMMREVAEMEYLWRVPHTIDGAALKAVIGPMQTTPRDTALAEALRDLAAIKA